MTFPALKDEPDSITGVLVQDPDGTVRAATWDEALAWADRITADGALTDAHPHIQAIRKGHALHGTN